MDTIFYTDGSKQNDDSPVGAAIFSPNLELSMQFKLPPETSIFTAEAFAILETLNYIEKNNIQYATIFSDSRSVLEAVLAPNSKGKSYLIYEIKRNFAKLKGKSIVVNLAWIPSHKGIEYNEKVDELAKGAISHGHPFNIELPHSDLFSNIKINSRKTITYH